MAKQGCWKNWAIVVPCGCGAALVVVAAIIFGIVMAAMGTIKTTAPYQQGVALAQHHPAVIEALGNPVEPGWFLSGNINTSGSSGDADFSVPLQGPEGEGTLYIKATREAGEWTLTKAEVRPDDGGERIDLLEE
jgi:hypothetical protein